MWTLLPPGKISADARAWKALLSVALVGLSVLLALAEKQMVRAENQMKK